MGYIRDVVQVDVSRETKPIEEASFGIPLVVGSNPTFASRVKYYSVSDLTSVEADLTGGTSDPEYEIIEAISKQSPAPAIVGIGKREVGDADWATALNAMKNENNDWYHLILSNRTQAEAEEVCTWALANKKIAYVASADASIIDTTEGADTTSLAAKLKAETNDRACCFYHGAGATEWIDGAYAGLIGVLSARPGSYTGAFKTPLGITVDDLKTDQLKNAEDKLCNVFDKKGGQNKVFWGFTSGADYLDTVIFADWLESRLAERIYKAISTPPKVPFNGAGISIVESAMDGVFADAKSNGAIDENEYNVNNVQIGGYIINMPSIASIDTNDKANRLLQGITFTCWYTGAIHKVKVIGTVTL
jgi:hypothetical protein